MLKTKSVLGIFATILFLSVYTLAAGAQNDYFSNWPAGSSPQEVGKRVAEHFLTSLHQGHSIFYGEVGTWYGALTFAQLAPDKDLQDKLIKRFDPLLPGGSET